MMMEKNTKWLDWAKEIQAISQAGLAYTKDEFDRERFLRLREISCEIIAEYTEADFSKVKNLFAGESGYQTPKVDVRAVIFKADRLLLVQEKADGKWALPGGWADIGLTPKETAVKEVFEETGFKAEAGKLLAVMDKKRPIIPLQLTMSTNCLSPVILLEGKQPRERKRTTSVFSHWKICPTYQRRGIRTLRSNFFFKRKTGPVRCTVTKRGKSHWKI